MPIPLAISQIVAVVAESIFYGAYTILFFATLIFLSRRRTPGGKTKALGSRMLLLTLLMYFLSLTHMILVLFATIAPLAVPPGGKVLQDQGSAKIVLAQVVVEVVNCTFADIILIWRVWVVWGRSYKIAVLPTLLLIAEFVTGILAANQINTLPGGSTSSSFHIVSLVPVTAACTLATNVLCTGLIAGRILWMIRKKIPGMAETRDGPLIGALLLILESGFIYSAAWLVYLVLSKGDPQAWPIISNIIAQLTGVIPTTIIVLAYLDVFGTVRGNTHQHQISSIHFQTRPTAQKSSEDSSGVVSMGQGTADDSLRTGASGIEGNMYELSLQDGQDGVSEMSFSGERKV